MCRIDGFSISSHTSAGTLWEEYLSHPIPGNAAKVIKIEYTPGTVSQNRGYWAPDLQNLRNQVSGSDSEAFKLTYRLIQKTDGGLAEDLTVILSHTVRARPGFFYRKWLV